jgi:hypothetical protein
MTFISFKPWHLDMMRLTDSLRDVLGKYPSGEIIERLSGAGLAYTVVVDEGAEVRIIGVVGAVPQGDGNKARVFVVASEDRKKHRVAFVKAVRQILDRARARFAIIEAAEGDGVAPRWFEWLGFQRTENHGEWAMQGGQA